jgi:YidC/Oxa1 family membrane protein insertase
MGVSMLFQARMNPTAPGMDETQAKIMKYMPMMFVVFLYNFSSGLTLYWTVSNVLSIVQTKVTKISDAKPGTAPAAAAALAAKPKPNFSGGKKKRKK